MWLLWLWNHVSKRCKHSQGFQAQEIEIIHSYSLIIHFYHHHQLKHLPWHLLFHVLGRKMAAQMLSLNISINSQLFARTVLSSLVMCKNHLHSPLNCAQLVTNHPEVTVFLFVFNAKNGCMKMGSENQIGVPGPWIGILEKLFVFS